MGSGTASVLTSGGRDVEDEVGAVVGDRGWVGANGSDAAGAGGQVEAFGWWVGHDAHGAEAVSGGGVEQVPDQLAADAAALCVVGHEEQVQFGGIGDETVEGHDPPVVFGHCRGMGAQVVRCDRVAGDDGGVDPSVGG